MRASLAILAVLGGVLVLTGLQGGNAAPAPDGSGSALGPNVGLRIVAPAPARTLPKATEALGVAAPSLGFAQGVRSWRADLERAGVNPGRDLLAPLSVLVISLERSCPPPALLACRPALRLVGHLRGEAPPDSERNLRTAIVAGLRTTGFHRLSVDSATDGFAGRVTSSGETLARWRVSGGTLEIATGGLALEPAGSAAALVAPPTVSGGTREVEIDTNPRTLAALLG